MDTLKTTLLKFKKVIIGAIVLAGLMFAYNVFVLQPQKAENAGSIRAENQSVVSTEIGREIIATLNRLKSINIDPDFFQEDAFVQLIDFSVDIEDKPVGKINPFKQDGLSINGFVEDLEGSEVLNNVTDNADQLNNPQ